MVITKKDTGNSQDIYGVFLYYFDEIEGHVLLTSYPRRLFDNKAERKILSIHSIWWLKDSLDETHPSVDLEIHGQIYSACVLYTKSIRKKRRPGMTSDEWKKELFVLIVRAPSALSFMAQELVILIKNELKERIGDDLSYIILKKLVENESSCYTEEQARTFLIKGRMVKDHFEEICRSLLPRSSLKVLGKSILNEINPVLVNDNNNDKSESPENDQNLTNEHHFVIETNQLDQATDHPSSAGQLDKKVKITKIKFITKNRLLRVKIKNSGCDLTNVNIRVIASRGFFEENSWETTINNWSSQEELCFEIKMTNEPNVNYFLKLEDDNDVILVKRLKNLTSE